MYSHVHMFVCRERLLGRLKAIVPECVLNVVCWWHVREQARYCQLSCRHRNDNDIISSVYVTVRIPYTFRATLGSL